MFEDVELIVVEVLCVMNKLYVINLLKTLY